MTDAAPKQPLHPSIIPRLDPEYVKFHNTYLAHFPPFESLPWNPAYRDAALPGSREPLSVGKILDFNLSHAPVRVYFPEGDPPAGGWPVFLFFHAGGFIFGNFRSEASLATNVCVHSNCVVVYVGYRLAPENPYPVAVEDAVESLDWVHKQGQTLLGINPEKIGIGGTSSGGNLAAVLALKAVEAQPPIPIVFQVLITPVVDLTASVDSYAAENKHAPFITIDSIPWYRQNYLPNKEDSSKWDASPIFAPDNLLHKVPKAWIAVAEVDLLRDEAIAYGEKLRKAGVSTEIEVYKTVPHPVTVFDALGISRKIIADVAKAVKDAFEAA